MSTARKGVYVAPSTLVSGEVGLYCRHTLARGDFIGFYDGAVIDSPTEDDAFCMALQGGYIDGNRRGVPCANEASKRTQQNAAYASYYLYTTGDTVPAAEAIGLWALRRIPADQEILTHYGVEYEPKRQARNYRMQSAKCVGIAQDPRDVTGALPLHVFVSIAAH